MKYPFPFLYDIFESLDYQRFLKDDKYVHSYDSIKHTWRGGI